MKGYVVRTGFLVCALLAPSMAHAQSNAVGFSAGWFAIKGEDGRIEDDVLLENRNFLEFDFDDFNTGFIGGEYLVGVGEYLEAGAGAGYSRRTVPTIYSDLVDSDGTEIDQDLKLRMVPMAFTARILPLGRSAGVQPYVGGGLGIINWRYSETGEFVDQNGFIFRDRFVADGTDYGPMVLAGLRVPAGSLLVGGELRYQKAEGDLDDDDFLADKIDLGGYTFTFNVHVRF